jgi:hypothetical protein
MKITAWQAMYFRNGREFDHSRYLHGLVSKDNILYVVMAASLDFREYSLQQVPLARRIPAADSEVVSLFLINDSPHPEIKARVNTLERELAHFGHVNILRVPEVLVPDHTTNLAALLAQVDAEYKAVLRTKKRHSMRNKRASWEQSKRNVETYAIWAGLPVPVMDYSEEALIVKEAKIRVLYESQ